VPRILLTADDFGRSPEVNAAIERWARAGALTQASLMVNEAHAAEAVVIARELPQLRVGLHLTLCDGRASDGTSLSKSPGWAGMKYAFWPGVRSWLKKEISAQFDRFREFGLPPTYWDGHTHLHLHPVVMRIALPLAKERGFSFTRLVREPGPPAVLPGIFRRLSERIIPRLRAAGVEFTDAVFGLRRTGRMDRSEFVRAFGWAKEGSIEIYFHPGAEACPPEPEWVAQEFAKAGT
jgi:chitin disaccharide deacetylase